jgi:hypothetical protein
MDMKSIAAATALVLLALGPAAAQTSAPRPAQTTTTNSGPAQIKNVNMMLGSDVLKANVYDKGENKIGAVDDLVLNKDGSPSQAIIGVGGFLGVGEKDVAIPFNEIKVMTRNGKNWLELDRSKDQLQAAPAYDTKAHKL